MNDAGALAQELSAERLDERLDGYRVLREVGRGAMGIVFEARQRGLERRVAVKILPPQLALRERTVRRFLREAESMGRLSHANIVDVYEVGSHGSLHFFAMRYIDGPPLDQVLKAGVLGIGDVVQVGLDVAGALAHAHSRGVLHRDVKPSNLLRDGERVVLTDFGLAKPTDTDGEGAMTESGDLVGTPLYMSPEQIQGETDGLDGRSDVWSLGVTLYELLIGRPPFHGTSAQSILHAILHKDPPLLRRQRADVPRDLEAVILKCLEKDRARRYSGAAGLHADLLAIQGGHSVSARPPRFVDPALRWCRRHPYQAAGLAIGLAAFGFFQSQLRTSKRDLAQTEQEKSAAEGQREAARAGKASAIARGELLAAVNELSDAKASAHDEQEYRRLRLHAFERVENLHLAIPFDQNPELAIEIARVFARFSRELEGGESLLLADVTRPGDVSRMSLAMRAAFLEGLDRLEEAYAVHQQRMRLYARTHEAWLDGARVLYRLALRDRAAERIEAARRRLFLAVELCDQALDRGVRARDEDVVATVLIERARCHLELGLPWLAEQSLRQALAADGARTDAQALLIACRGEPELPPGAGSAGEAAPAGRPDGAGGTEFDAQGSQPVAANSSDPAHAADPAARTGAGRAGAAPRPDGARSGRAARGGLGGVPLLGRVPETLEIDREDLANAGRNLTSIYRGLRDVLRNAAGAPGTPDAGAAPGPGAPAGTPREGGTQQ